MKKFLVIALSLFLTFGMIGLASANGEDGPGDKTQIKMTVKDNNVLIGKGNTGIQGNKNHHNVIVGGDVNVGENAGGTITNTATGGDAKAVVRDSGNSESNSKVIGSGNSKNTQVGIVKGGDQKMKNEINIEGDTTYVEADKREHIQGPNLQSGNAKVVDTKASNARAKGGLFEHVDFLTMKQAKMASKNASDMDVEPALIMENDFQTKTINIGKAGEFAGHIYIFSDGSDSYLSAMDAEASEVAMKMGLTHIRRLDGVETSKHLEGSAWNIGVGGGASILTNGEDLALAPNGGAGYGKAKSASQMRPDAVYEVYFAKELIKDLQKAKSTTKYTYTVADR